MSYFSNKPKGSAEDVAIWLREQVMKNLTTEANLEDGVYIDIMPMYPEFNDHQFSGGAVTEIQKSVQEVYDCFNTSWRLNIEDACDERRKLLGGK